MTALATIMAHAALKPTLTTGKWRDYLIDALVWAAADFAALNGKPLTHTIRCGDERHDATIWPKGMAPSDDEGVNL